MIKISSRSMKRSYLTIYLLFIVSVYVCVSPCQSRTCEARTIKIGLLEEPKTLNIWLASDTWSIKVLSQLYQPLYIREPRNLKLIPWLARDYPVYDPATLSYTVKLRPVRWSDGSELTSEDIAFTGNLIKTFKVPRMLSNWEFIRDIETPDRYTVRFLLKQPKAIFATRTLTTPVVQKDRWHRIVEDARQTKTPLVRLLNYKVTDPESNGPFVLKDRKEGAYVFLEKNRHFFGKGKKIEGHLLGPYIDGIVFKIFGTTDAAILALKKGTIDMFWWGLQPGYLYDLKREKEIEVFSSEKSALYYICFNLRRKPFDDVNLRKAIAVSTDKEFIVKRILQGHAVRMDSIVPPSNITWYCPDVPKYGEGLNRETRIRKAYKILREAGYTWERPPVNEKGKVVNGEGIILPDGSPMERFTILTPPADYDPHRAMVGIMLQEWLRMLGIPAFSRPMPLGSLIQHVRTRHQFDLFVLGYGNLSLDPDYLRNFFISRNDRPKGWNTSGYRNPEFDRIADASASTIDLEKRKALIWEMQEIIMRDLPFLPLYCPTLAEGVRKDSFTGWVKMVGGIGNTWSFCQIRPK